VFALLIKETAIIVPLFYIIYILSKKQTFKVNILFLLSWTSITLFYFIYRHFVLQNQTYKLIFNELFATFSHSLPAITKYIANIFFPFKLSVFPSFIDVSYLLSIATILVFVLLLIIVRHQYNKKIVLFGFLCFFFFLFPTFVMPENQFYDHRIYLPMVGILIVILEMLESNSKRYEKKIFIFIIMLTILFAFLSFFHEGKFKNRQYFWINALVDSPNSDVANASVAELLDQAGKYEQAEKKYLKAIRIKKHSRNYVNLAVLYLHMNKVDKAEQCLLKALELRDDDPIIYYNLAFVYSYKGNKELAIKMKEMYIQVFKDTNKCQEPVDIKI